jgi:hypothetical protein
VSVVLRIKFRPSWIIILKKYILSIFYNTKKLHRSFRCKGRLFIPCIEKLAENNFLKTFSGSTSIFFGNLRTTSPYTFMRLHVLSGVTYTKFQMCWCNACVTRKESTKNKNWMPIILSRVRENVDEVLIGKSGSLLIYNVYLQIITALSLFRIHCNSVLHALSLLR